MGQAIMGFRDGSGISWTTCKQSAPRSTQITTPTPHYSSFTDRMLFLTPNQQRQSAESTRTFLKDIPQKYSKTDAELVAIRKTSGQRVLTKGCIAEGAPKISPSPEGFLVPMHRIHCSWGPRVNIPNGNLISLAVLAQAPTAYVLLMFY